MTINSTVDVKTSELIFGALDWVVAKVVGETLTGDSAINYPILIGAGTDGDLQRPFSPSTSWDDVGPLIEKYRISIDYNDARWAASTRGWLMAEYGMTPLIAVCRAIVAAKFGDVVTIDARLIN